ncbi:MAG: PAC2 family protein, partial [Halobacteria archaeon]|nr:PAC2 family protein [Halobacteria archaeon]
MSTYTSTQPEFKIEHHKEPSQTLIIGLSDLGIAGLTAADYLSEHLELDEIGHITSEDLPSITPFENGKPRHHTRLFSRDDLNLTVLVGELFIPLWAADPFSKEIIDWTSKNEVEEIVVLSGIPIAHGPEEHKAFYVATDDYREKRLKDSEIPPMGGGFLEGVHANL